MKKNDTHSPETGAGAAGDKENLNASAGNPEDAILEQLPEAYRNRENAEHSPEFKRIEEKIRRMFAEQKEKFPEKE